MMKNRIAMMCPRCDRGTISAKTNRCDRCDSSARQSDVSEPGTQLSAPVSELQPGSEPVTTPTSQEVGALQEPAPTEPVVDLRAARRVLLAQPLRAFPTARMLLGAGATLMVMALVNFAQSPQPDPVPPVRGPVLAVPLSVEPRVGQTERTQDLEPVLSADTAQPNLELPPPPPEPVVQPISRPRPVAGLSRIFVSTTPWGQLFIDGVLAGNTPRANLPIEPGPHTIRIVRYGFEPFEREIVVMPGDTIRLTNIVLRVRQ